MTISFDDITKHVIPIENFELSWRFLGEKHCHFSEAQLKQITPLDAEASLFLWNYIQDANLHAEVPFKKDFFRFIDQVEILSDNEEEIKSWLFGKGFPFDKNVYLSWSPTNAMIVPWAFMVNQLDCFYYSSSDDLTVIDHSLDWALLFFHENEIYFGSNLS